MAQTKTATGGRREAGLLCVILFGGIYPIGHMGFKTDMCNDQFL